MLPDALVALSDDALNRRRVVRELQVHAQVTTVTEISNSGDSQATSTITTENMKEEGVFEVKFKAKNAIIEFISDIAVLLTFGGIFPPVAFIGVFAICSSSLVTQLMLGRVIVLSRTQPALRESVERINEKCGGVRILMIR